MEECTKNVGFLKSKLENSIREMQTLDLSSRAEIEELKAELNAFNQAKNEKYRVRQRGCSLTYSARTPPAVHQGITIWVDEIEFEKK